MKTILKSLLILSCVITVFAGCKKDEPSPEPTTTTTPTTAASSPQFTGSFNGTAVSFTDLYVSYSSGGTIGSGSGDPSAFEYSFSLFDASFQEIIEVEKGTLNLPDGFYPSNSEFDAYFPLGTSNYDPTLNNGVIITHTTPNGVVWSTALGTANQSGSTFEIVNRVVTEEGGDHVVKVKIIANCKLYDGLGGTKTLTNAVIIGSFANL